MNEKIYNLFWRYSLFPENCLLKEFMQIHGLKGFQVFFFAQKYFESIDPYLSNVVRVGCSEKIHTFYVYCKSSTRCSSTLLQLYIADNLMNFYRLSIKALRQRNFHNKTWVKAVKETDTSVALFTFLSVSYFWISNFSRQLLISNPKFLN